MFRYKSIVKKLVGAGVVVGGGALISLWSLPQVQLLTKTSPTAALPPIEREIQKQMKYKPLPPREEQLTSLETEEFDVLVIGGGATGCGVTLDATSRGLKTAMVEKFDYAAGTSSRSTKLIHGGVRYLQKAILGFDKEQYNMVKEALNERANLLEIAPHLAYPLPIMLPVYKWWQIPYYYAGIKCYDIVAGRQLLKPSYFLSKSHALELFPMLKKDKLKGALVYYDGQHDDARMCLSLALTSARLGATIANHTEVLNLLKTTDENGKERITGARVRDNMTGKEWNVKAKSVINATGPYTDLIRNMDNKEKSKICQPSSGVHIVLPSYYSPSNMGLLDPSTSDGRVIFFLPWQNSTMAGTTDNSCELTHDPQPTEAEIQFILKEVKTYLNSDVNVRRGDVLSAWSGIRPLVRNPNSKDTQSIARNHIIEVSESGLVTIAGGKWTTYRSMAEETVDTAIDVCDLKPTHPCCTQGLLLEGAHDWTPTFFIRLIQDFGVDIEVAQHLTNAYGDRAINVAKLCKLTGNRWPVVGKRLHEEYPYIEAEVTYAVREYAQTAVDILARRTRLAFLNAHAAEEALPRIIELMAEELDWDHVRQEEEKDKAIRFLRLDMGLELKDESKNKAPINLTKEDIGTYIQRFRALDVDNKGFITVKDLRRYFERVGEEVSEDKLHDILGEVDLNRNAEVDVSEFLHLMSAVRSGHVGHSRFAMAAEHSEALQKPISITRSGGGV